MNVNFEIAALFSSSYSRVKKNANFITNIHLVSVESYLYYLSSRIEQLLLLSFYDHWLWKRWRNYFYRAHDSLSNTQIRKKMMIVKVALYWIIYYLLLFTSKARPIFFKLNIPLEGLAWAIKNVLFYLIETLAFGRKALHNIQMWCTLCNYLHWHFTQNICSSRNLSWKAAIFLHST